MQTKDFSILGAIIGAGILLTLVISAAPHVRVLADTATTTVTVGNANPTLTVSLNQGNDITLVEATSVSASTTITITDPNGCSDITSVTASAFRASTTASGSTCTQNDNNCYLPAVACAATTTGNTCTGGADTSVQYDCGYLFWYIADPTDAGVFAADIWVGAATATDAAAGTGTATNSTETVEVNTLQALDVTALIAYGSVGAGSDTGAVNQVATTTNTGNTSIDIELSGDVMCNDYPTCAGAANERIQPGQQEYALAGFTYGAGTDLTATSAPVSVEVDLPKPTATTTAVEDPTFWGIGIPGGQVADSYTGQDVFTAIAD